MSTPPKQQSSLWRSFQPIVFAGTGGIVAQIITHPIDTIKTRIQVINEEKFSAQAGGVQSSRKANPIDASRELWRTQGYKGFYKGVDAAVLRQAVYGSIRMGLYRVMLNQREAQTKKNTTYLEKSAASIISGLVGAIIGNPADVSMIRLQMDSLLPTEQRRNYTGVGNALVRIVKEEGVLTLWRGCGPTVLRACCMNFGMMSSFDQIKETITHYTHDPNAYSTKCISSFCAGVIASFVSLPADNVKTKLMKMKVGADGKMPYKGIADCFLKSYKREGFFGFWIGIETYISRVGPHAIISLLVIDYLNTNFGPKNF